ncbi:hypothetical protein [Pedobacter endophyticus]|uniref:Uncharacterized protein n=1 Tax=Pedobacter endophyticus TaxID=2789740 RepID=A0A7U3SP61_9SPHI|nr:hypothetical protein [Pedobacter endophyticus]QPH37701.1 hypothetical protein IZT61_11300 [Pedobacter endophyticus]
MVIVIDKKIDQRKVKEALKKLEDCQAKKTKLADFYGKLKNTFGDGVEYQEEIRGEWN